MKTNYSQQDIDTLKRFIADKKALVTQTVAWAEKNLKYEQRNEVLLHLKSAANTFNKILQNIDAKPVMALFGSLLRVFFCPLFRHDCLSGCEYRNFLAISKLFEHNFHIFRSTIVQSLVLD